MLKLRRPRSCSRCEYSRTKGCTYRTVLQFRPYASAKRTLTKTSETESSRAGRTQRLLLRQLRRRLAVWESPSIHHPLTHPPTEPIGQEKEDKKAAKLAQEEKKVMGIASTHRHSTHAPWPTQQLSRYPFVP